VLTRRVGPAGSLLSIGSTAPASGARLRLYRALGGVKALRLLHVVVFARPGIADLCWPGQLEDLAQAPGGALLTQMPSHIPRH
jgi:hypothetical protein